MENFQKLLNKEVLLLTSIEIENKYTILSENGFLLSLKQIQFLKQNIILLEEAYSELSLTDDEIEKTNNEWLQERKENIGYKISHKEIIEKQGIVYLIKNDISGLYKIGITQDITQRIKDIRRACWKASVIHAHYNISDYKKVETLMHDYWKSKREYGEWFSLNETDVDVFKKWDFVNEKQNKVNKQSPEWDLGFIEPKYLTTIEQWLKYKWGRRESYKSIDSIQACYKKLLKLSNGDPKVADEIITESMSNNWAGFFALKIQKNNHNPVNNTSMGENLIDLGKKYSQ